MGFCTGDLDTISSTTKQVMNELSDLNQKYPKAHFDAAMNDLHHFTSTIDSCYNSGGFDPGLFNNNLNDLTTTSSSMASGMQNFIDSGVYPSN